MKLVEPNSRQERCLLYEHVVDLRDGFLQLKVANKKRSVRPMTRVDISKLV